jgi:predicted RNase H-like HicB family nuclease
MRYAVVIEKAGDNYSAYVPDLVGCVATGAAVAEVETEIRDAIRFHIEGLREDGRPVPEPQSPSPNTWKRDGRRQSSASHNVPRRASRGRPQEGL